MLCCRWRSQQQGSCPRVCGILGPVCLWINQYFMQEVHAFCWGGICGVQALGTQGRPGQTHRVSSAHVEPPHGFQLVLPGGPALAGPFLLELNLKEGENLTEVTSQDRPALP